MRKYPYKQSELVTFDTCHLIHMKIKVNTTNDPRLSKELEKSSLWIQLKNTEGRIRDSGKMGAFLAPLTRGGVP